MNSKSWTKFLLVRFRPCSFKIQIFNGKPFQHCILSGWQLKWPCILAGRDKLLPCFGTLLTQAIARSHLKRCHLGNYFQFTFKFLHFPISCVSNSSACSRHPSTLPPSASYELPPSPRWKPRDTQWKAPEKRCGSRGPSNDKTKLIY